MINYSDFPIDSWDKSVDISEIREIIREEVKAELDKKQLEEKAKLVKKQLEEKKMKWKIYDVLSYRQSPTGRHFAVCPFCNYLTDDFRMTDNYWKKLTNYCPNCGAKMIGEENES